ncbi:MAG: L-2-amino-thiazoline-4-carboxylic acid hydrolase [Ignavibacteria bacterium]|jgi:hypothetical protein
MNNSEPNKSRRKFITCTLPLCAVACFLKGNETLFAQSKEKSDKQDGHKFDKKSDRELTVADYFNTRYSEFIKLAKIMEKELGKEKVIAVLKENTKERAFNLGQDQAKKIGSNSLQDYVKQFRPPAYKNLLTHEIVEDTDTAFEIKVTECIWAKTFSDADAGDIGFAHICFGDYSWTEGFNTKMKMVRDKTLMEGHDCCNHRYELKA